MLLLSETMMVGQEVAAQHPDRVYRPSFPGQFWLVKTF